MMLLIAIMLNMKVKGIKIMVVQIGGIINNHKNQGERKTQSSMVINFISPKDSDEIHTLHTNVII